MEDQSGGAATNAQRRQSNEPKKARAQARVTPPHYDQHFTGRDAWAQVKTVNRVLESRAALLAGKGLNELADDGPFTFIATTEELGWRRRGNALVMIDR